MELGQAKNKRQRGHEQRPAPDAEEPGEDAREQAEDRGEQQCPHQTSSQIPTAASSTAKASESVRLASRCWSEAPTTAPTAPGSPTIAAAPGFTSPWNA